MNRRTWVLFACLIGLSHAMVATAAPKTMSKTSRESWGTLQTGESVDLFTLQNANGMTARITSYGGIIVSLTAPDRAGAMADVVLGFDSLAKYEAKNPFFGCITGRYANRIGVAAFKIDGKLFRVTANSGKHQLHGGKVGFDKKVWHGETSEKPEAVGLILTYRSQAGEEGFPGNLDCKVTYWLTDANVLEIEYEAKTDAPTVVNLTNHSYFNLGGEGSGDILGHEMMIPASTFTATDDDLIPTGELASVAGTPLDFREPHLIGERIGADFKPLIQGIGYDHNYVLGAGEMKLAARLRDPKSGRVMEVTTTEVGVQFYSGNHLKGVSGKAGHVYEKRHGLCLETQRFPDSPNQSSFPSSILRPGETYRHVTHFKFLAH
jgi:aldose 1-epimerase